MELSLQPRRTQGSRRQVLIGFQRLQEGTCKRSRRKCAWVALLHSGWLVAQRLQAHNGAASAAAATAPAYSLMPASACKHTQGCMCLVAQQQ